MKDVPAQGDIIKITDIVPPVLVVSKPFFNSSGEIIGCPILKKSILGPLHIPVSTSKTTGVVQCEKMTLFDLNVRGFFNYDSLPALDIINITDAIQSIFDYVSFTC